MAALSVFIADVDDSFIINAMKALGNSNRARVIGYAKDGQTALRQVNSLHPNVLLADTHLPVLDGIELIRRSRDMKRPPLCIADTRFYSDIVLEATLSSGAAYCLYKPICYERLSRVILDCWESRRYSAVSTANRNALEANTHANVLRLKGLLDRLGFPIRMCGSIYMVEAMLLLQEDPLLLKNLSKGLYVALAEKQRSTPAAVERALRNAIDSSYTRGRLAKEYDRRPSNRAFLEYLLREMAEDDAISVDAESLSKSRELML